MKIEINKIYNENSKKGLKKLPSNSIDCCVTSPPYWGLRDYGVDDQIGLENTPDEFVKNIVEVFNEVYRVLKEDGTLWLIIGDSYAGSGKGAVTHPDTNNKWKQGTNIGISHSSGKKKLIHHFNSNCYKPKDLIGIPWMVAFALRNSGWYLRQDIIWSKPNPMPESVKDRCTKSHEYIFLLSKSQKYYYDNDSIKTPIKDATVRRVIQDIENQKGSTRVPGKINGNMKAVFPKRKPRPSDNKKGNQGTGGIPIGLNGSSFKNHNNFLNENGELIHGSKANKKSVWEITTKGYKEAHFATYPEKLIVDCIKAGCKENGIVLDPFMGAGTTALVAKKLNRNYLGFELNPEYVDISEKRLRKELGLFS
ncbi:DNA-methyltransferase [Abyssalbus ytuae]|uniref:Methyltransferase n=1 Tax=Abyssalbus ytuae TaxID=2926907 RepID=A0A9E7D2W6_9FLAO|nr:site-specific DNA-methyltransferase [Abyssalbus ytuae]UOB18608.1 site-specific DNA-methyltransferase [Abyssalbus ytuae]